MLLNHVEMNDLLPVSISFKVVEKAITIGSSFDVAFDMG